jgi:hypothetical protein
MAIRPTERWREDSVIPADRSESLLVRIDEALQTFETEVAAFVGPSDEQIFGVVERVVLSLNTIDAEQGADFDTIDREEFCEYIDEALTEGGVDVEALAIRRGIDPAEITDEWRDW